MRKIFVSDYGGTITDKDFYSLLVERYIPADTPDYFAQHREGRITHFEAMAAYFAFAPTEEQELVELLEACRADPDLGASAALLQRAGWELLVVSAGSSWYVERVLRQAGVTATIYSNSGHLETGRELVLDSRRCSPPTRAARFSIRPVSPASSTSFCNGMFSTGASTLRRPSTTRRLRRRVMKARSPKSIPFPTWAQRSINNSV